MMTKECAECGQVLPEIGIGGEYPCSTCGVPQLHDPAQSVDDDAEGPHRREVNEMSDGRSDSLRVAEDRVQEPETSLHVQSTESLAQITALRTKYEALKAENALLAESNDLLKADSITMAEMLQKKDAENVELRAQAERLSEPVSDGERAAFDAIYYGEEIDSGFEAAITATDSLIAARAKPPEQP